MKDESLRALINGADLVLPDGAGVVLANAYGANAIVSVSLSPGSSRRVLAKPTSAVAGLAIRPFGGLTYACKTYLPAHVPVL